MDTTLFSTSAPVAPESDVAARRARFTRLQDAQLRRYGVQARSRFVNISRPAMRVHLLACGAGEPVLFLHGGDGEAVDWAPLMAELQHDVHLIGVDRPGFGLTDSFDYAGVDLREHAGDFVSSVLDALDIPRATLIGGSMGGFFALSTALDHPERVKRVVLAGFAVGLVQDVSDELLTLATTPGATRAFMQQAASLDAQREQYRHMFGIGPDTVPEEYFETRLAGLTLPGSQDTWALLLTRAVEPATYLGNDLSRLTAPVLILWGERDMAPPAAGAAAAARLANAQFVTMPNVGHFPFLEAPQQTAAAIRTFFAHNA